MSKVKMDRRTLLTGLAAGGAMSIPPELASAQQTPLTSSQLENLKHAPQVAILPRSGNMRHNVHAYVTVTCQICFEVFGSLYKPLLQDKGITDTVWIFTIAPRNPRELIAAEKFMAIEQPRRAEALMALLNEGDRAMKNRTLRPGMLDAFLAKYPKESPQLTPIKKLGLLLANNYFYRHLRLNDMPGLFVDGKPFMVGRNTRARPRQLAQIKSLLA